MTPTPISPKVTASSASGALLVIVVAILKACHLDPDPTLATAIVTLVMAASAYLTPDRLRELGARQEQGRHADNHNGIPDDAGDHLEIIPAAQATSDTKADAAGYETP